MDRTRPRWRTLDEDETQTDIRIDAWREPEPTQAVRGDQIQLVIQLPTRSQRGKTNILMTPEVAEQIGQQLIKVAQELKAIKTT
jgi:hypothetical protein